LLGCELQTAHFSNGDDKFSVKIAAALQNQLQLGFDFSNTFAPAPTIIRKHQIKVKVNRRIVSFTQVDFQAQLTGSMLADGWLI